MIQVQDKVIFLVNNLSGNNLEAKAKELKAILTSDTYPWFANYMVVKRAAQEANFHHLYLQVRTQRLLATMIHPYWIPFKLAPGPLHLGFLYMACLWNRVHLPRHCVSLPANVNQRW